MQMSFMKLKKTITVKVTALVIAGMLLGTTAVIAQESESQDGQSDLQLQVEEPAVSSGNSGGVWGNSAGSSIGTPSSSNSAADRPANPNLGPGGGSLNRPAAPTGITPPGNPDVPFDDNMNLGFLAIGLVFAFVIFKKRLSLQPITVKSKQ